METGFHLTNCVGKQLGVFIAGPQDVEGEPLRRFAADAGQLLQFVDEPRHRLCKFGQGASRKRPCGGRAELADYILPNKNEGATTLTPVKT